MAITKISAGVIGLNAVTATIVAENVIGSSEIATNSITTLLIADNAVTGDKLSDNIDIAGTLDVTGVLTADSNVVIAGNLTVNGSTVTNSSTNTTIEDALIELGTGTSGSPANDAGILIERGSAANAFMGFDESTDKFIVATTTATGASTGNLSLTAAPLVTGALTASGLSYPTSDGSANQVLTTDGSGALTFTQVATGGAIVDKYTATGNGSTTAFDTGINPQDEVNTWVHIDGVYQNKSEYSYNGTTITFTAAPENGALIEIISGVQAGFSTADSVLGVYTATTSDTDTYDTGLSATSENNVNIFIEGVYQPKSTFTWSGSTITFDANTPVGLALEVVASKTLTAGAVVTASMVDDAVTAAKLASNSVVSASIVNNSITGADISATTNITAANFIGNVTGNVTGNISGNLTGTLATAAQPNITSLGTLTSFRSTGIDDNADALAITIDSSENVMIGKTSTSFTTAGIELAAGGVAGKVQIQRASSPLTLVNLADDGAILNLYKGTTNIGSIGTVGGDVAIYSTGSSHAGLRFAIDTYLPTNNAGAVIDATTNLGTSAYRYNDIYLSGGVRATSTLDITVPETAGAAIKLEFGNNVNDTRRTVMAYKDTFEPAAADTGVISLGQAANKWKDLYLSGKAYVSTDIRLGSEAVRLSTDGNGEFGIGYGQTATNSRFTVYNNTAVALRVLPNGNVGIGTSNPSTPLHVYSNTSGVIATISGPNNYNSETGISLAVDRAKISGVLNGSGGSPGASLRFYTQPDSGSLTERMRINSTGQVLAQAHGVSTPSFSFIGDNNTGMTRPTGDTLQFICGGTVKLRVSGDGLLFNSDTAAANALDDYEEGTWTPVVKLGTTTVTSSNSGFYTKIGRIITLQVQCAFSNLNSGTGNLTIEGIPFTSANVAHRNHGSVGYYNVASSFGANGPVARISRYTTFIDIQRSHEISPAQHGHMASNSELYITITYKNE